MNYGTKAFGMFGPAKNIAKKGRFGDTLLAHINPQEARMLKRMGGSGTVNPFTGALEFFTPSATREDFDPEFYLSQNRDVAAAGYGTGEGQMDPFEHYNQFVLQGDEKRAGNIGEQQQKDFGAYTGMFDEDYYLSNNQDVADALAGGELGDITTARGHFDAFGRNELRAANPTQKTLRDAGSTLRFGPGLYGESSERAGDRFTSLLNTGGRRLLNEEGTGLRADLMGEGDFNVDLFGGTSDMTNEALIGNLGTRASAVDRGYLGNFDPDTITAFDDDYRFITGAEGTDDDPATVALAENTSNISRAGLDVTEERNRIRDLGYTGRFGGGGPEAFIGAELAKKGLQSTGNITNDMAMLEAQNQYDLLQTELENAIAAITGVSTTPDANDLVTTQPVTTAPVDTIDDIATDTAIDVPDLPFNTGTAAPVVTASAAPVQNFRNTRINPFTGALEYIPNQAAQPSAFSQRVMNPRFSGGFGQGIRL